MDRDQADRIADALEAISKTLTLILEQIQLFIERNEDD